MTRRDSQKLPITPSQTDVEMLKLKGEWRDIRRCASLYNEHSTEHIMTMLVYSWLTYVRGQCVGYCSFLIVTAKIVINTGHGEFNQ